MKTGRLCSKLKFLVPCKLKYRNRFRTFHQLSVLTNQQIRNPRASIGIDRQTKCCRALDLCARCCWSANGSMLMQVVGSSTYLALLQGLLRSTGVKSFLHRQQAPKQQRSKLCSSLQTCRRPFFARVPTPGIQSARSSSCVECSPGFRFPSKDFRHRSGWVTCEF